MEMLPTAARDLLTFDLADAHELAAGGDAAAGCRVLAAGLERAEAARDAGEPWGKELVRCYQVALEEYPTRHGSGPGNSQRA